MAKVEDLGQGVLNPVIDTRLDKVPVRGILAAAEAMKIGMKYEVRRTDNWRFVPAAEHYNHALRHMMLHHIGDTSEPHLGHAVSRVLMWADLELEKAEAADGAGH